MKNLEFVIEDNFLKDIKNDSGRTTIVIPDGVTTIGSSAFTNCQQVTKVVIPKSVTEICAHAFEKCAHLTNLEIPNSVNSIDVFSFAYCTKLESIHLPDGLKIIADELFSGCNNLASITIPKTVTSIGNYAFSRCGSLKSLIIPNGVTEIGGNTFSDCSGLTSLVIPSSVTEIGRYAFYHCSGLTSIEIPNNVNKIDKNTFLGCEKLTSVTIPDSVTEIENNAFCDCTSLTSIAIPNSVKEIGPSAFSGCSSLKSFVIPNQVTKISQLAFSGCNNLASIVIPHGVTKIDRNAFYDCSSLTTIAIPDSVTEIGESAFAHCSNLHSIKIPSSVKSIGQSAFSWCQNLETLTIPSSVTEIGGAAFDVCSDLKHITLPNKTNSILSLGLTLKNFNYLYFTKDGESFTLCDKIDHILEQTCYKKDLNNNEYIYKNRKFRENFVQLQNWKAQGIIKFIPPEYVMMAFPSTELKKFFIHNNNQRWAKLMKSLGFDTLKEEEKNNSLSDLMKIYYAIGGFSENQGESEKAFEYIQNMAKIFPSPEYFRLQIHSQFARLDLTGPYNKMFAQFFMKYYCQNPNFMLLVLKDKNGHSLDVEDYLCAAHNSFNYITKCYPNRFVNGNEERALLSPQFVAEHCLKIQYSNVKYENEALAELVGRYGYSQDQFEQMQHVFERAKTIKNSCVIQAGKEPQNDCVTFRLLEKDDPLGFVLGDITNCCQVIGGAATECVIDGYQNPNAGFIVFEDDKKDENGKPAEEKRILGQAYIWYDPNTKTVCYDNIEIPSKILDLLSSGEKHETGISTNALLCAIDKSAESIMQEMNMNGVAVETVTTGVGYNDLKIELHRKYGEPKTTALATNKGVYSDAKEGQFVIKTYDQITNSFKNQIQQNVDSAAHDINEMQASLETVAEF